MRVGKWKKALSLMLAVVLTVCLASCGKTGDGGKEEGKQPDNSASTNSQLAKQYVYSGKEVDLLGAADLEAAKDNFYIEKISYVNGRVHILVNYTIWPENGNGVEARTMVAVEEAVEEVASEDIAIDDDMLVDPGFGVEEPDMYVVPIQGYRVISFLPDGSDIQYFDLLNETEDQEEESADDADQDMGAQSYSSSWFNQITFGADSNIYAIRQTYHEDYSDPGNPIYEEKSELVCWDQAGSLKYVHDINSQFSEEEYIYVRNLIVDQNGNVSIMMDGEKLRFVTVDPEGQFGAVKEIAVKDGNYLYNVFVEKDGQINFLFYEDQWTKQVMRPYDSASGTVGEALEMPANLSSYGEMLPGITSDFVMSNSTGVYTYNMGDSDATQIMDYVNSDLEANYLNHVTVVDDTHLVGCYNDMETYEQKVAVFTKVAPEDIPDKTVLVFGANYLNSDTRKQIIQFNKTNLKYRITVRDYSKFNTMEDYMASYSQLNNDILAGKMPDILEVDTNIPLANYISKGLIADVGKLIESDEELSQVDFMDNVFEAFRVNGVLYEVVPSFNINTMAGKVTFVGDRTGWNMEEFMQVTKQLPEGVNILDPQTDRASFLNQMIQFCGTDFIDTATGTCKFDSQDFISMLEFAASLPEEVTYDEDFDWEAYDSQYREDRTVLMPIYMYSFRDLNYTINGQMGGDISMVGFPNESRSGSVVNCYRTYALSAKSEALEGAWEFVRYYLTDEYQETFVEGSPFSVNRELFLKQANEATKKPHYVDENGEKVEYDQTIWLNNEEVVIDPMTQEEVDRYVAFVESINRRSYFNEEVMNIITEEAAYFFEGQKSAKEAADIIQNRVRLYVMENS